MQWTSALTDRLRLLAGLELRNEQLVSPSSFDDRKQVQTNFTRAFFTTEWRPVDALVFNAGALHEYSTQSGDNVAPRLMVNWHPAAGHTLRAGYSSAFLPPSAYEKYALVIYRDRNGGGPLTFVVGNPALRPERVEVSELGYHLAWPQQALSMDLRAFDERVSDGLRSKGFPSQAYNGDDYRITGVEWQLDWRWRRNTRLFFSSTLAQIDVANSVDPEYYLYRMQYGMARNAESLALLHTFDNGLDLGLTWSHAESVTLASVSRNRWTFNLDRLDLRLAKQVRVGGQRGEWALTLQNLGGPMRDGDWKYTMLPRAFVSLRLDF